MKTSEVKKAKEIVDEMLSKLRVNAKANVFAIEEYLKIEIEGPDAPILIGFHGDNLQALRQLFTAMIKSKVNESIVVMVDVAGYIAGKESRIQHMAQKAIDAFKKSGEPESLPQMSPFERRIAHSYITDQGYNSESVGEGDDRHIVVSK